eukprot:scaffold24561_cov64-Attheya_sp.AAC.7
MFLRRGGVPFAPPSTAASIGWSNHSKDNAEDDGDSDSCDDGDEHIDNDINTRGRKRARSEASMERVEMAPPSSSIDIDIDIDIDRPSQPPMVPIHRPAARMPTNTSWRPPAFEIAAGVTVSSRTETSVVLSFAGIGSEVTIVGRAFIKTLQGQVEILGYRLSAHDHDHASESDCKDTVYVESPKWMSTLTLVSRAKESTIHLNSSSQNAACVSKTNNPYENPNAASFEILSRAEVLSATTIPREWEYAVDEIRSDLQNGDDIIIEDPQQQKPLLDPLADPFGSTPLEEDTPNNPLQEEQTIVNEGRIVICGAKGVGKSTCLRYALNRLLSKEADGTCHTTGRKDGIHAIAVLDCDVGQPELSVPGMLTLTILNQPLLSPPHAHLVCGSNASEASVASQHERAFYFGHLSSKQDPTTYIQALSALVEQYEHVVDESFDGDETSVPLLVNTDGWVKSMGLEILSTLLLDVVKPKHVIQIVGATKSKFFYLTQLMSLSSSSMKVHVVETFGKVLHEQDTKNNHYSASSLTSLASSSNDMVASNHQSVSPVPPLRRIASATSLASLESSYSTFWTDGPAQYADYGAPLSSSSLRSLRTCAYFLGGSHVMDEMGVTLNQGGILDPENKIALHLAGARPYAVPFDSVRYFLPGQDWKNEEDPDQSLVLDALNGSVVGLCHSKHNLTHNHQPATPKNDTDPEESADTLLPCFGIGIVRSIDRVRRLFYILTPLPASMLQKHVNTLVGASIGLPLDCIFRGIMSEAFPYQSCDCVLNKLQGSDVMKSRHNLAPKGKNDGI